MIDFRRHPRNAGTVTDAAPYSRLAMPSYPVLAP